MSRQWIIIPVLLVGFAIYYPFSTAGRIYRNMHLAEEHIVTIKPQFAADPRFAQLTLSAYTGEGGSLMLSGAVATQAEADAASDLLKRTNPPCPVAFAFFVRPTTVPTTRPQE